MAYNNTVTLIGNMGSEARVIGQEDGKGFAAFSLATADSYQDENEQWVQKDSVWHNILAFSPAVIGHLKGLKSGTRIKVTGSISYRGFDMQDDDGTTYTRREASIIAWKVEQAPLVKRPS